MSETFNCDKKIWDILNTIHGAAQTMDYLADGQMKGSIPSEMADKVGPKAAKALSVACKEYCAYTGLKDHQIALDFIHDLTEED